MNRFFSVNFDLSLLSPNSQNICIQASYSCILFRSRKQTRWFYNIILLYILVQFRKGWPHVRLSSRTCIAKLCVHTHFTIDTRFTLHTHFRHKTVKHGITKTLLLWPLNKWHGRWNQYYSMNLTCIKYNVCIRSFRDKYFREWFYLFNKIW